MWRRQFLNKSLIATGSVLGLGREFKPQSYSAGGSGAGTESRVGNRGAAGSRPVFGQAGATLGDSPSAIPNDDHWPRGLETFGTAGKEGTLYPDHEVVLLRHEGRGCLTFMWFGGSWPGYERTRIRVYVDGEATPSIDMELFLGHGIGWDDPAAPWGTERLGKTGQPSGLFNTYRIPFGTSIRITGQLGAGVDKPQTFWWIMRGVENLPVTLGHIRLPSHARLRLQVHQNITLKPFQMFDIARSPGAGALYQVTLVVASPNWHFLEGMVRAYLNGAKEPLLLSSGTEDYFLGTYYFNRGGYHLPLAGLTHKSVQPSGSCRFSAYRFHVEDPVVFQQGWRLVWRNGEEKNGKIFGAVGTSQMTSYAWVYEG